eukprot:2595884-Rhodomonas_salina.1
MHMGYTFFARQCVRGYQGISGKGVTCVRMTRTSVSATLRFDPYCSRARYGVSGTDLGRAGTSSSVVRSAKPR